MGNFAGFQSVKLTKPKTSMFDLTHDVRLSTRMGRLTPCLIQEAVPSDSFRGSTEILLRLAPLLAPIYDQINLYVHFFFVPNRLLWEDWEEFITGGRLGVGVDPLLAPIPPHYNIGGVAGLPGNLFGNSSLSAYLGVPNFLFLDPVPGNWNGRFVDLMPYAAYQLVWMEYYRDRNFIPDDFFNVPMPLPSGGIGAVDAAEYMQLRTRNYMHDYFTSALPWTQRGEEVQLPFEIAYKDISEIYRFDGLPVDDGTPLIAGDTSVPDNLLQTGPTGDTPSRIENLDFSSGTTINDFRAAYALQVWLERNAVGGSRYTESTQAHFGVKPQDSRLQRPEYIGGGRIPVKISEVLSTAWSNDGTADVPLANMGGHGVTYGNTNEFRYFCTEHGFIIGFVSIMNPPSYQQGLPNMFRRESFLDYPWPTFAKLGEQEVHNYEIWASPASMIKDVDGNYPLFGYQSRYADWKYVCSRNAGEFRNSLLFWTLTRIFESQPVLSATFNEFDDATQNRIFAIGEVDADNFWLYCHNKVQVKRPLPYFGTPNTMGFV